MAQGSRRRQPSSIDKLPPEVRETIGRLRTDHGFTIDQILEHLQSMEVQVSRSALGRHVKGLAEVGEQLRHSREMATALVREFGAEPDDRVSRLNIELMHGVVMRLVTAQADGEGGDGLVLDAEEVMFLARSLKDLASAQKTDADRILKTRQEVAKAAAGKAVDTARARGISGDTVEAIRQAILGVA